MRAGQLIDLAADLIWPRSCMFCGAHPDGRGCICAPCAEHLPLIDPERKPMAVEFTGGAVSVLEYEGVVREAVHRFKFEGCWHYAEDFGALMAARAAALEGEFDAVCHVPVSARRRAERGYDQSLLLAQSLCRRMEADPPREILCKVRHTPPQSGRKKAERNANVLGAFALSPGAQVQGLRLLLVDDVVTTGATLGECARILRTEGAAEVLCLTLCKSEGHLQKEG